MRALVLSDIHGNLEALEAVLAASHGLWDEIWNLGDVVGYGGSPNQVVERIRALATVHVRGNHDRVCCGLTSPDHFNPVARTAALWTQAALTAENVAWLKAMPQGPVLAGGGAASCAHGSPLDEDQYLLTQRDARTSLEQMSTSVTFFGHTHVQGGFLHDGKDGHGGKDGHDGHDGKERQEILPGFGGQNGRRARSRQDSGLETTGLTLPKLGRALINPGSVGQPRDRDWRAAYAIFSSEERTVTFCRVPYDVANSQRRILDARLPERLAARLREGR